MQSNPPPIYLVRSDITVYGAERGIDVIVNSANPSLAGIGDDLTRPGGGVDGAIHRAAGIKLYEACQTFACFDGVTSNSDAGGVVTHNVARSIRCAHGDLRITDAFGLPYRKVFHAVAPQYLDGNMAELMLLESLYNRIFSTMVAYGFTSMALPPLGTRSYGMPKQESAHIAVTRALAFASFANLAIFFCVTQMEDFQYYASNLAELGPGRFLIG